MQFNPITHQLATCTSRDFGFWSEDLKQVPKYTVDSPITSCSWTSDGYNLVLGFGNGEIGIYNRVCLCIHFHDEGLISRDHL